MEYTDKYQLVEPGRPSVLDNCVAIVREDGQSVWIPKIRLSPSKMILWEQCQSSLKYALDLTTRGGDTIYTLVGTAVHSAIELINKGQEIDRENFLRDKLQELCKESDVGLEFPKSYKESNKLLQEYEVPYGWHLNSGEVKHVVDMGLYTMSYIIDATWHTDVWEGKVKQPFQRYRIEDYKSSAAKPKTNLQLHIYAAMEQHRLGLDPTLIDANFFMTRTGQRIEVTIDEGSVARTKAYIEMSVKLMYHLMANEKEFPATAGAGCFFCQVPDCTERI